MNNNNKRLYLILTSLLSLIALGGTAVSAQEIPIVEILVTGRQPGPPLWRVSNGENELYLFARIDYVPARMQWESRRVETAIANAEEFLGEPGVGYRFSGRINPLTAIPRVIGLGRELRRNPKNERLQEVLPPPLYQRFANLKAQHFPRNRKIEKLNPRSASALMAELILEDEGLATSLRIEKQLRKLMSRNKGAIYTTVQVMGEMEGGFKEMSELAISSRDQTMPEAVACFAARLERMETEVAATKFRANAWARGDIDDFWEGPLPGDPDYPCRSPLAEYMDPDTLARLELQSRQQWLDAAELALGRNRTSFAILNIRELLNEDGLLTQLGDRGYAIREP